MWSGRTRLRANPCGGKPDQLTRASHAKQATTGDRTPQHQPLQHVRAKNPPHEARNAHDASCGSTAFSPPCHRCLGEHLSPPGHARQGPRKAVAASSAAVQRSCCNMKSRDEGEETQRLDRMTACLEPGQVEQKMPEAPHRSRTLAPKLRAYCWALAGEHAFEARPRNRSAHLKNGAALLRIRRGLALAAASVTILTLVCSPVLTTPGGRRTECRSLRECGARTSLSRGIT